MSRTVGLVFGNSTVHVSPCTLITNHIVYKYKAPVLTPHFECIVFLSRLRFATPTKEGLHTPHTLLPLTTSVNYLYICSADGLDQTLMAPSSFIHWVSVCLISEPVLFSSVYGGWFLNKVDLGHGKGTSGVADSLSAVRLL